MMLASLVPLLPILVIGGTAAWVYYDDKAQCERGTPVGFVLGSFRIDAPAAWAVACILMWLIFFPLYLTRRSQ